MGCFLGSALTPCRKHIKRHTRPYGCTFPKCNKVFGSKNDWKRHENSQHFQLEMWRCQLDKVNGSQQPCAEVFWHRQLFEGHLRDTHRVTDKTKTLEQATQCRIGRNNQSRFWCGFCKRILPLAKKEVAAWDERFNHIDEHFKRDQKIINWHCVESNKSKHDVMKDLDREKFDDSAPVAINSDDEWTTTDDILPSNADAAPRSGTIPVGQCNEQELNTSSSRKRRRTDEGSEGLQISNRRDVVLFCVSCWKGYHYFESLTVF